MQQMSTLGEVKNQTEFYTQCEAFINGYAYTSLWIDPFITPPLGSNLTVTPTVETVCLSLFSLYTALNANDTKPTIEQYYARTSQFM